MRYVALNTPFVIRNGASSFPARQKWSTTYLTSIMTGQTVTVAKTPHGNADSIVSLPSGGNLFVKPYETDETFPEVLQKIQSQELHLTTHTGPTHYAQTQNDNLRNEYAPLFADVPQSIPFARIALEKDPDAINFWLGNSHSTTALHKDNYENIYVQILGRKHFTLLPPIEAPCVNERSVLSATYDAEMRIRIDDPHTRTPFAMWDPAVPEVNSTPYSRLSQPVEVTLEEGDMLYLPALWYHKVGQSCNPEGVCVAVNYWYDLEFSGGFWSMASFVRGVGVLSARKEGQEEEEGRSEMKS
jgi:jumonji domain-containing protein 7